MPGCTWLHYFTRRWTEVRTWHMVPRTTTRYIWDDTYGSRKVQAMRMELLRRNPNATGFKASVVQPETMTVGVCLQAGCFCQRSYKTTDLQSRYIRATMKKKTFTLKEQNSTKNLSSSIKHQLLTNIWYHTRATTVLTQHGKYQFLVFRRLQCPVPYLRVRAKPTCKRTQNHESLLNVSSQQFGCP